MIILKKHTSIPLVIKLPLKLVVKIIWKLRSIFDVLIGKTYKQIVVCGYPRSGTSLLHNMFSASLDGFYYDEFETKATERIHRYGNYLTKTPLDIFDINKLDELNIHSKDVYVIIVIRDIRDVITSRHPNIPGEYFIGYDHSWWPQNKEGSKWEYDGYGVIDIYHEINSHRDESLKILKVKYEEMVFDSALLQKRLEAALDIKFDRPISEFYKDESKLAYKYDKNKVKDHTLVLENKPINSTRAGKWENAEYFDRIREQFSQCPELFEILKSDGYESDDSWFDAYR